MVPGGLARQKRRIALQVTVAFLLFGLAWVLLSDLALYRLVGSPAARAQLETAKGWAFVVVSAVLLYAFVRWSISGIQRAEAKGDAILESIAEGVLTIGPDGKVVAANPAAVKLLRVSSAEALIGMDAAEFARRFRVSSLDGRLVPPERYISQRALRGEVTERYQAIIHREDGTQFVSANSAAPIRSPSGRIEGSVSLMRDVTPMIELERIRDRLYAAAAHSLKTPVAIIKGHAQLLTAQGSPQTAHPAKIIDRQCRRIDTLIQNLLVLTRLRTGSLELHPEEVDVSEVVEAALRQEGEASGHGLELHALAHPRARLDRERMELVVRDLIEIARARARPGSDVSVTISEHAGWAGVRAQYQRQGTQVARTHTPDDEIAGALLDELDEHTGLRVGRHVVARVVKAHGGAFGLEERSGDVEFDWVRVPLTRREDGHVLH